MKKVSTLIAITVFYFICFGNFVAKGQNWTPITMPEGIELDEHEAMISSIEDWKKFYKYVFNINIDLYNVKIPLRTEEQKKTGFHRLIIVAKGVILDQVFDVYKMQGFNFRSFYYVRDPITHDDRSAENGSYAIWVRNRIEADEELKNTSANQLKEKGVAGITLLERLLLGLFYYRETGNHLDIENTTLCNGSRLSGGAVPTVYWILAHRQLDVDWQKSDIRDGDLRSREVIY